MPFPFLRLKQVGDMIESSSQSSENKFTKKKYKKRRWINKLSNFYITTSKAFTWQKNIRIHLDLAFRN